MEQRVKAILRMALIVALVVFVSGCADTDIDGETGTDTKTEHVTMITVSAAASLTEAFTEIETAFETDNPGIDVNYNFAGSGTLRMQIEGGAPIDVFASASQGHMNLLAEQRLIKEGTRRNFAANTVVLIAPVNSEVDINDPKELTGTGIKTIAIGNPETAPVGKYTVEALTESGVWPEIESKTILAENVKQVLIYVERNEVDAGFVYSTDAMTGDENSIRIAATLPTVTAISYPIALVSSSENKDEAQRFIDFTTSDKGRTILESYGFTA